MARNVDTTQILAKMKVIPRLSKENVAIVNKEYFDEFEKNLEATHACGRFADKEILENALDELDNKLPIPGDTKKSKEALVQYIMNNKEFWDNIEGKTKYFDPIYVVNKMTEFSLSNGGREEICLCSALCRYLSEWTAGSVLDARQRQHRFPLYNEPVCKALEQLGYAHATEQDLPYYEFARMMADLSQRTGLNYVELDHILWIYGKTL